MPIRPRSRRRRCCSPRIERAIEDLQAKRADLDRTLKELKDIRAQCVEHLAARDGTGRPPCKG